MDSSFGNPKFNIQFNKNFDGQSQNTSALGVSLRNVEIPCPYHPEEPSNNYCIENKCYQPLCSECIEDHLLHHKKHGYSDLSIKSLRGTRKECIAKLGALIQELLHRLSMFEAPVPPEQQLQILENKLESIRQKMHEMVESQVSRIRDSLRTVMGESVGYYKSMADIHSKLEDLIEQLRQTHVTLIDGRQGLSIPDCLKKTLTLDVQALLQTFTKEGTAYEARRAKSQLQLVFHQEALKECISSVVQVSTPQSHSNTLPSRSAISMKQPNRYEQQQSGMDELPAEAFPRGNGKLLYFFETSSNKLHLISADGRKQATERIIPIPEFIVPTFHASIISNTAQFIFLSGGIVELNGGTKSPLFIRYSVKTQTCKKDFAKVKPRSSHSLCEDSKGDIYILGGYGPSGLAGSDPSYELTVERVNPRSGRVDIETPSNWGGSNISMSFNQFVLKACQEGIQLYSRRLRQWIVAGIQTPAKTEFNFMKNPGFACLSDSEILVFGGYFTDSTSSDSCYLWTVDINENPTVRVSTLNCRLPIAQGFENCCALVDSDGLFALQNVQEEEDTCLQNERRLLRFSLREKSWKFVQLSQQ